VSSDRVEVRRVWEQATLEYFYTYFHIHLDESVKSPKISDRTNKFNLGTLQMRARSLALFQLWEGSEAHKH
jgi:hypothetical protein